jgi:predicted DCC family thiol-disulfide oxidoreductase YuxK
MKLKVSINTEVDAEEALKKQPILLFDGECGFCNRTVQFFLRNEKNNPGARMHFAPLQSEVGMALKKYFGIDEQTDSIILIKDHSAYIKSCAALRLTRYMKGPWPVMMGFLVVPPFMRNVVYDFIAKKRMRIFGRVESCELLKKEDRERFLSF